MPAAPDLPDAPSAPCVVRFDPEGRRWRGDPATPLALAAAAADILIEQPCGARGSCGRCRVRVVEGRVSPDPADVPALGPAAVADGWRLGCRVVVRGDLVVEVPAASRVVAHKSFGGGDLLAGGFDPVADAGWGVALDVGSTTLAAAVVEMATGAVAATASALNPQVRFGGDVMSRIAFARATPDGDAALHRAVADAARALVAETARGAGIDPADIGHLVAVGNPTMLHALQRLPVGPLGEAPFQGERYDAWSGEAGALDLAPSGARAWILPGVRAHLGADAVAAILAAGLDRPGPPRLLMDLGTNTELVLAGPHGLLCASAASGPAFEGAALRHGMRAVPGAIDRVRVGPDGELRVRTIGDEPALGICGSGVVDAVAELLRAGVLEPSGRMRTRAEAAARAPAGLAAVAARVVELDGAGDAVAPAGGAPAPGGAGTRRERAFRLVGGDRPVDLTASDVREIQLVKGSIGAAVALLLREAGVAPVELDEVLLAGAFGSYIAGDSARTLGLIPAVDPARIRFVGNAAGAGARLALVDGRARERAERVASEAHLVELAGRAEYQEEFVAMLGFPAAEETE